MMIRRLSWGNEIRNHWPTRQERNSLKGKVENRDKRVTNNRNASWSPQIIVDIIMSLWKIGHLVGSMTRKWMNQNFLKIKLRYTAKIYCKTNTLLRRNGCSLHFITIISSAHNIDQNFWKFVADRIEPWTLTISFIAERGHIEVQFKLLVAAVKTKMKMYTICCKN